LRIAKILNLHNWRPHKVGPQAKKNRHFEGRAGKGMNCCTYFGSTCKNWRYQRRLNQKGMKLKKIGVAILGFVA